MTVTELFKAMSNSVERVHLYLADGGPVPSSLGTYVYDKDWKPDGNAWVLLDPENGIPERYHNRKVTSFYLYEAKDGERVIDIGISMNEPDISERERRQYDALRLEVERIREDKAVRYLEEDWK